MSKEKNICIVGSAPHSLLLAPYASDDWTIWGCSPGLWATAKQHGFIHRFDGWFEVHRYGNFPNMSPEYRGWMESLEVPVFTSAPVSSLKNNIALPVEELVAKHNPYFFNSSVSWMFAMALEMNPDKISLYGIDMAANEEYFSQKMGCIYFALEAQKRGITVAAPYESDLFTPPPLYGVCEHNHAFIKMKVRREELQARLADAEQRQNLAFQEATFLRGALDDLSYCSQTWAGNMAERQFKFNQPLQADQRIAFQEDASRWAREQCEADTIAMLEDVYKDELKKKPRKVVKKKS